MDLAIRTAPVPSAPVLPVGQQSRTRLLPIIPTFGECLTPVFPWKYSRKLPCLGHGISKLCQLSTPGSPRGRPEYDANLHSGYEEDHFEAADLQTAYLLWSTP